MNDRRVHAVWCDDIRQEVGNKPSFMGVYTHGIVLSRPTVLPRLSVFVWVSASINQPFKNFSVRVQRDDGTLIGEIPTSTVGGNEALARKGVKRGSVMAALIAGPVPIPENCEYLEVVAYADGEELERPKLWIEELAHQGEGEERPIGSEHAPNRQVGEKAPRKRGQSGADRSESG